ncbi:hypothetical protein GGR58DRAFT_502239 [Xylaria digitata]|nr:hypothetical protein GGR58DRAFT_502239 [Xylaria digitata]
MNPYESSPDNIPATDLYADIPLYGRYFPTPNDFQVDPQRVGSRSQDALQYWSSVVSLCTESVRIYPADEGGRDVFALGSVIINGRQVLVQERLAGVALNVAFPYLSEGQRAAFKQQAREILGKLHTIKPEGGQRGRFHVVQDPNILDNGRIGPLERDPVLRRQLDNDDIVGLVDWEMARFFGWKMAGEVHHKIRTPQGEHFANARLSEEKLRDIMWWNDLYDDGIPEPSG